MSNKDSLIIIYTYTIVHLLGKLGEVGEFRVDLAIEFSLIMLQMVLTLVTFLMHMCTLSEATVFIRSGIIHSYIDNRSKPTLDLYMLISCSEGLFTMLLQAFLAGVQFLLVPLDSCT